MRTAALRELDRRRPGAAGRGVDQHALTRLQVGAVVEPEPREVKREVERGGVGERNRLRHVERGHDRADRVLGEAAVRTLGHRDDVPAGHDSAPAPHASTMPITSMPGLYGRSGRTIMLPPLMRSRSLRLSGIACTRTRTSPASGSGTGTSSSRSTSVGRSPYVCVRHACIDRHFVMILPVDANVSLASGFVTQAPAGSNAASFRIAVVVVPLNRPAVTFDVSFSSSACPFTGPNVPFTVDVALVFQTSFWEPIDAFASTAAAFVQLSPVVDFPFTVDVADLTPPPVQPLITVDSVIVGLTVAGLFRIGRPGENPTKPVIFVQPAPAAPAGIAPQRRDRYEQAHRQQQSSSPRACVLPLGR